MAKHVPTDTEFESAFGTARVSRTHLARYYLRAIEKTRKHDPQPEYVPNDDVADINLEHVLPLNPSADWNIDAETAKASQKLLGNMVLLKAGQNKDIANKTFAEKKVILAASGYQTTSEVAAYEQWTNTEIKERQAALAKSAVETWPLTFN